MKSTKQIDYLLGLHKFDELIKMFCDDAEDKLEPAQIAFDFERVFSTLFSMHKKKTKGGGCNALLVSLENAPDTFSTPELKTHASSVAQVV